mgnify:CR=1 FL=1
MTRAHHQFFSIFLLLLFAGPAFTHAITVEITATVPGCGDGAIGNEEQCDGLNLGGSSCSSLGFTDGSLLCTSACTFNTSSCTSGSSGSGGGGGGASVSSPSIPATNVVFTGRAYPLSRVTVLKDGQAALTTIAGPDSNFSGTISGLSTGNYQFSVYSEDSAGRRSSLFAFPIYITSGVTTKISGIFIAPTIATDKSEIRKGDNIAIFGQSVPSSEVTISVNSEEEFFVKKIADSDGAYLLNFDTSVLEIGQHQTQSKSALNGEITAFGETVEFVVGTVNVLADLPATTPSKGDVNGDQRVNLVDFSVVAYWHKRENAPASADLNADGEVDLVDFSIMAFYWTG